MRRSSILIAVPALLSVAVAAVVAWNRRTDEIRPVTRPAPRTPAPSPGVARAAAAFARLPLRFEGNRGQHGADVRFAARGPGFGLAAREDGLDLHLSRPDVDPSRLRIGFPGARAALSYEGIDPLPGRQRYYRGSDPRHWITDVPLFSRILSRDLYPGIDLILYGNPRDLEYDFVVAPGADPSDIALRITGASRLEVDAKGDLVIAMQGGDVRQSKPVVYQESPAGRQEIAAAYVVASGDQVRFSIGAYDRSRPLVIDPVLIFSTFLGGTGDDSLSAVRADGDSVWVAGSTTSLDFPLLNPLQSQLTGNPLDHWSSRDLFVSRFDATGTTLLYSTYLGGVSEETAAGMALDPAGNVFVCGTTSSGDFPVTGNAFQPAFQPGNGAEAFVLRLDGSGALVYSSFLGGHDHDFAAAIAVDTSGAVFVCGGTHSTDFPIRGAVQPGSLAGPVGSGGPADAWVAKIDPSISGDAGLIYSTYLAGTVDDRAFAVAVDPFGNAYVGGMTTSADFPTTPGALQTAWQVDYDGGPTQDAFVVKLTPDGSSLVYSTYLGGHSYDVVYGIAVDDSGHAYVTGLTDTGDFPVQNPIRQPSALVKSANGGVTWSPTSPHRSLRRLNSMAVDPQNGALYATSTLDSYRSADDGGTWTSLGVPLGLLAVNPQVSSTLYSVSWGGGVLKSIDTGATWAPANVGLTSYTYGLYLSAIMIHPFDSSTVFVAGVHGLFKSVDGGASWTLFDGSRGGGAIHPTTGRMYVAGPGYGVISRSDDGGQSWITGITSPTGYESSIQNLIVHPLDPDRAWAGTRNGVYRTTDGGFTWQNASVGLVDPDVVTNGNLTEIHALVAHPTLTGTVYAATSTSDGIGGGVYKTTDGGTTWARLDGSPRPSTSLALDPLDPDTIYAGTLIKRDAFVSKIAPDGASLVYSTYLGGEGVDWALAIQVDGTGAAYVAGITTSLDFPASNPIQAANGGGEDAFVAKISASGGTILFSTYLGGEANDFAAALSLDSAGNLYVGGICTSATFPLQGPYQAALTGGSDAFLAKMSIQNTETGTDIPVDLNGGTATPGGLELTFPSVIEPGDTVVETTTDAPPIPEGFKVGEPATYYDITTTATFSGAVEIRISYAGVAYENENLLRLLHFDGGQWVDITTSVDTVNDIIIGQSISFSPFVLVEPYNRSPIARAGDDRTVEAGAGGLASVTLDGAASSDPDGDALTYQWTGSFGSASGPTPTVSLGLGDHTITLFVSDGKGGLSTDDVAVRVVDTTPPAISAVSATPATLMVPNHKMIEVRIAVSASDLCDPAPVSRIVSVSSNQTDFYNPQSADWILKGALILDLRAEHSPEGLRVYTVVVECTDASGNVSTGTVKVVVPRGSE